MRACGVIIAIVTVVAGVVSMLPAIAAHAQTPASRVQFSVQVVYDANNNGIQDPTDPPLEGASVGLSGVSGTAAVNPTATGADGVVPGLSLAAGTYIITALGPQRLPGDSATVCRGWRDSFVTGVPVSPTSQPSGGFGFGIDLSAADTAGVQQIVVGVSDKAPGDSAVTNSQIICASQGGANAALPATGTGPGGGASGGGFVEVVVVLALGLIGARVLWAAYPRLRRR